MYVEMRLMMVQLLAGHGLTIQESRSTSFKDEHFNEMFFDAEENDEPSVTSADQRSTRSDRSLVHSSYFC